MSYQYLLSEREGRVERLTLNRPEVRNALNDEVISELTAWADRVRGTRDVDVVVLAGSGSTFSAGADIAWMARTVDYSQEENLRDARSLSRMFVALDTLPVPVVGRVQGAAFGGGAGLAAICDVVVADDEAVFGFTEVRLGIVPAVIAPFVMAKIGRSAARELFLTGARFSAGRALELGLVHALAPRADLDQVVAETVREILKGGPEALAATKALIPAVWSASPEEAGEVSARAIAARRASDEGQEGLRAFLAKRPPRWNRH